MHGPPIPAEVAGAASSACIGGFNAARITPGGLLNHLQALSQQRSIAVVQVDVISGGAAVHQANCLPHHKGHGLCLCLEEGPKRESTIA